MHVMLDLETLGMPPHGVIATIGAVAFDPAKGQECVSEYYATVLWTMYPEVTGTFDAGAIKFWLTQHDMTRGEIIPDVGDLPLERTLPRFTNWAHSLGERVEALWSNGPLFDEILLRNAYDRVQQVFPFHYSTSRCYRTIRDLANLPKPKNPSKHNALEDAKAQARLVCDAYKKLGLTQ